MSTVAAVISASVNIVAVSTTCFRLLAGDTSDTTLPTA